MTDRPPRGFQIVPDVAILGILARPTAMPLENSISGTGISCRGGSFSPKAMNTNLRNVRKISKDVLNEFSTSCIANPLASYFFFCPRSSKGPEQQ